MRKKYKNIVGKISTLLETKENKNSILESKIPLTVVKDAKKTLNTLVSLFEKEKFKYNFSSPSIVLSVEINSKTFIVNIMDNWITVSYGRGEIGSGIDEHSMLRLIDEIKKNIKQEKDEDCEDC